MPQLLEAPALQVLKFLMSHPGPSILQVQGLVGFEIIMNIMSTEETLHLNHIHCVLLGS